VPLASVTNHDDRAGLICSMTALGVASGIFPAVGDEDGWIILPPLAFVQEWARLLIELNAGSDQSGRWIAEVPSQAP
jgi:hypothetical protein